MLELRILSSMFMTNGSQALSRMNRDSMVQKVCYLTQVVIDEYVCRAVADHTGWLGSIVLSELGVDGLLMCGIYL